MRERLRTPQDPRGSAVLPGERPGRQGGYGDRLWARQPELVPVLVHDHSPHPVESSRAYVTVTVIAVDVFVFPALSVAIAVSVCVVFVAVVVFQLIVHEETVSVPSRTPST